MSHDRTRRARHVLVSILGSVIVLAPLLLSACDDSAMRNAPLPHDTPIIYTYIHDDHAGVRALSARDGTELWHAEIGHSGQPVLAGDMLFTTIRDSVGRTQDVIALRVSDGKVLWRTPLPSNGCNCVLSVDATTVVVDADLLGLYALDATTGKVRWHRTGLARGRPVMRNGVVYAFFNDNPTQLASSDTPLTALRSADGAQLWSVSDVGFVRIAANSSAVFGNDGPTVAIAAHLQDGHRLWENSSAGWVLAADDTIVLVNGTSLAALDPKDGHLLWRSTAGFGSVAVTNREVPFTGGYIYGPGRHDNEVIAVRAKDGTQAWDDHFSQSEIGGYYVGGLVAEGSVVFALLVSPSHTGAINLFCQSDCTNRIVALDGMTGAIYWQLDDDDAGGLPVRASPE